MQTKVVHAELRSEYVDAIETGSWDIILCDYDLPGLNATEAFHMLRLIDKETPFVVVSGGVSQKDTDALRKAGVHDIVLKSEADRLAPAILSALA